MNDIFVYETRKHKIGDRIKSLREAAGFTQEQLASKMDALERKEKLTKQNTISSWENGKTLPPLGRLIALSVVFNCDISYLLCDYDERKRDISDISNLTGLSEKAVNFIVDLGKEPDSRGKISALDYLLTCDNMEGVLSALIKYLETEDLLQNLLNLKREKQAEMIRAGVYKTNLFLENQISGTTKENSLNEYELSTQFGYVIQEVRRKAKEKHPGGTK